MFARSAGAVLLLATLAVQSLAQDNATAPAQQDPVAANTDFQKVADKLDMGGTYFFYTNAEGVLDSVMAMIKPFGAINPQAKSIISMVDTGLRKLGLAELNDFGMSTALLRSGAQRKKCYLQLKQREGLFALAGGEPGELESISYVPADAAAAWSGNAEFGKLLPLVRQVAEAAMGPAGEGMAEQALQSAQKETGINFVNLMESFGNEWGIYLRFGGKVIPAKEVMEGKIAFSFVYRMRVTSDVLLETAKTLISKQTSLKEEKETGGVSVWQVVMKDAEKKTKIYIGSSKDWFIVTNDLDELKLSQETYAGKKNLLSSEEFKKLSAVMPAKINAISFVGEEYVKYTEGMIGGVFDEIEKSESDHGEEEKVIMESVQKLVKEYALISPYAAWRVNDPNGIQWVKVSTGATPDISMTAVAGTGIMVAVAVPAFLRARENSRGRACQSNLAKLDGAKEQYALEHKLANGEKVTLEQLKEYVHDMPVCPAGGTYTLGKIGEDPTCSYAESAEEGFEAHTLQ